MISVVAHTAGNPHAATDPVWTGCSREVEAIDVMRPSDELRDLLAARCREGVHMSGSLTGRTVTIDLIVQGSVRAIGIVSDALDAGKIRRDPSILDDLGLDRVYAASALDCLMNPEGVAASLSKYEGGLFRPWRREARGASVHIEVYRPGDGRPGGLAPRGRKAVLPGSRAA